MKKLLLSALVAFSLNAHAQNADKPVKSNVKAVKVFLNRAQITNNAQVYIPTGSTTLVFEDLSTKIDKQSIQVSAKGNLTIMSVKHQINYLRNQTKAQKIKFLEDSVAHYTDTQRLTTAMRQVLTQEQELILANKSIGGDGVGVNAQKLKEVAEYYRTRLSEIALAALKADKDLASLSQKIARLQFQINELNRDANKPTSEVLVTVSASSPTTADFELDYIVPDAGWTPIYDLRAKDAQSPIQLSYKANVFQNTGVDWKDVKVTLSTGNPSQSGVKPELSTWYVNYYNPIQLESLSKNRGRFDNNMSNLPAAPNAGLAIEDKEEEAAVKAITIADQTVVNNTTFATEFEISVPYTILSDGKPQLVDIKNYEVKTNYEYSVVPKKDYDAFLMAKMTGWGEYNLLSGQANVYFEGSFVGETFLNVANTKDTLAISLGRDKRIVVKRVKIQDLSSKKFIGSNIKEELGFEIQIRNNKKDNITITIEEQIPVSKQSDIEVELVESQGAYVQPLGGRITWKTQIKPSELKKFVFKYSIKYPKNKQITFE
jgi:uncharacterized protein (TIGR02231 family)